MRTFLFVLALLTACADLAPAQYTGPIPQGPYPGQYPGQYPGGIGLPIPRRRPKSQPGDQAPTQTSAQNLQHFQGTLRHLDRKSCDVALADSRTLTFLLSDKTSKEAGLQAGDYVSVDSTQDDQGVFHAVSLQKVKQEGSRSASAPAPKPRASSDDDDERPRLRRHDPEPPPGKPDAASSGQARADAARAELESTGDAPSGAASQPPGAPQQSSAAKNNPAAPTQDSAAASDGSRATQEANGNAASGSNAAADSRPSTIVRREPSGADDDDAPPVLRRGKPTERPQSAAARKPQPAPTGRSAAPPLEAASGEPQQEADLRPLTNAGPNAPPASRNASSAAEGTRPPAAPSANPHEALLEQAQEAAMNFVANLPNFVCREHTTRYTSQPRSRQWDAIDIVIADAIFENGNERYQNITVNGKAPSKSVEETGAWSTGQYGLLLQAIFHPATQADFRYGKDTVIAGKAASIYDFDVTQERSRWKVSVPGQSIVPAYHGSVWVDQTTARVLRLEIQAVGIPAAFPDDRAEMAVDYDYTLIGSQKYLLPSHAEVLSCSRSTGSCERNAIDFRNYHKYSGESTIVFEDAK